MWTRKCASLLLALAWPVAASALTVVARDFRELVERAELILEGTVAHIDEAPDPAGIQRTLVTLTDLELHKGTWPEPTFVLDVAGGTKNGLRSQVLDLPVFTEGERVLLFVRGNGREVFPIVGVHQGYFRIETDSRGQKRIARCDGLPVLGRTERALRFAPRAARPLGEGVSLEEFRSWIRDELDRVRGGR